MKAKGD